LESTLDSTSDSLSELESEAQAEVGAITDEDEDAEGFLVEEEMLGTQGVQADGGAPVVPSMFVGDNNLTMRY